MYMTQMALETLNTGLYDVQHLIIMLIIYRKVKTGTMLYGCMPKIPTRPPPPPKILHALN